MGGGIPENMYKMGENGSGGEVANSYGELVNRSEMGTALARSNYPWPTDWIAVRLSKWWIEQSWKRTYKISSSL